MTETEEKKTQRQALIIIAVFLTVAAICVVVAGSQEKAAPKEPIAISQDEARVIQIRREAWDAKNERVISLRQEFERAVEARAEARLEFLAEVQRTKINHQVPDGWTLDFESGKWQPPQSAK